MSGYSISRRNIVKGLGAASVASFIPGSLAAQTQELVIVATGGAFEKALKDHFYDVFTQQTGIRIRAVAASNSETWTKLRAMQQTNNVEWDIVTAWPEDLVAQQALIESFDCGKLTNLAAHGVPGACQSRGLLRTLGAVTITYDKSKYPNGGPQNWADFWNIQKFPGPRSLPNAGAPWWPLMAALMADGVPKDKLFPLDLDRAFKKLDEIRPHINVWWRTGDQSQQMLRSGEVNMAMMWSGRAFALVDQKMPLEVVWEGAPPNTALWSLVKGSKNTEASIKFLDFFVGRPDAHLPFANAVNFDTANRSVLASLTADQLKTKVTAPANASQLAVMDAAWDAENRAALLERWNRWLAR